jgi:photosystem II stability/assembly factor-like uncharacterized protein
MTESGRNRYTMKNRNLLLGTASVALAAAAVMFVPKDTELQSTYQPRTSVENRANAANDAAEYLALLHANVKTGKVEASDFVNAQREVKQFALKKGGTSLTWTELGPDNSGGRTRSIKVNPNAINEVWVGSCTGGLFKSTDGGTIWSRVESFHDNLAIGSIEIAGNGYIYVGTGNSHDNPGSQQGSGSAGNGVYVSADAGATWLHCEDMAPPHNLIPVDQSPGPGNDWTEVNDIYADPNDANKVWVGGNAGFYTYTTAGAAAPNLGTLTAVEKSTGITTWNRVDDFQISPSGKNVIVAEGTRTWVSNTFGTQGSFNDVSNNADGFIPFGGVGRIEFDIAPSDDEWIYAAIANSGGFMLGVYHSQDGGNTWAEINPGGVPSADAFASADGERGQGRYDNCVTVLPHDKTQILVGGIRLFSWKQAVADPSFGQWEQVAIQGSLCFGCVHSDIHEFEWDSNGWLYIGTDGGVYKSNDVNNLFYYPSNRGFNTAQFYGISHNAYGHVFGGTQDNGMFLLNQQGFTLTEAVFSNSGIGDGFTTAMSHYFPDVMFGTSQYAYLDRTDDGGGGFNKFVDELESAGVEAATNLGPFYTSIRFFETVNDPFSIDSIFDVSPGANDTLAIGDTLWYESNTQGYPLYAIMTAEVDSSDHFDFRDPVSSLMVIGLNGGSGAGTGVWVTRQALDFSVNPDWWQILDNSSAGGNFNGETALSFEWTKDGSSLYVGCYSGAVFRVDGFSGAYTEATGDINDTSCVLSAYEIRPGSGGVVTGLSVAKNDNGHLIISTGGFGGNHVYEHTSADVAGNGSSLFTSIQGNLPNIPAYSCLMDVNNESMLVVGTEYGVYSSDDGGATWFDQNATMDRVPVFHITQQHRDWGDGLTTNAGVIYLGTHGRGAWKSDDLVSARPIAGQENTLDASEYITNLNVYPNPMTNNGVVEFELNDRSDVLVNIFDLNGRLLQTMNFQDMASGAQTVDIDASRLASGTYFVSFETASQRDVAKFVVNK